MSGENHFAREAIWPSHEGLCLLLDLANSYNEMDCRMNKKIEKSCMLICENYVIMC